MRQDEIEVGSRKVAVSNLDKVLFPATGFKKGQVIDYYVQVSGVLLPHLKNRALTLKRYPGGVRQAYFYEKECPSHRPKWVKTASVWSKTRQADIPFCMVNDLASLVWIANLADLELHTSLATHPATERPTMMVFDLDPGPGADILDCAWVGCQLRELLEKVKLKSFPKTSGSKGLQVYVPLNTAMTFEKTKAFSRTLAEVLEEAHPEKVVAKMAKVLRKNKVLIDWSQNDHHKTTVCVYSLRAKEEPSVSTPMTWKEVEKGLREKKARSFVFTPADVVKRVEKFGDLFEPVLTMKQKLTAKA